MSTIFRIVLIASSFLTVVYTLYRIHKNQLRIQDSIFWIVFSFITLILALFLQSIVKLANLLGVVSPANLVFLIFIFVAYIKLFSTNSKLSALENKLKTLTISEAMREKEQADKEAEDKAD